MALEHGMIEPFVERQITANTISFGLSSYGYDFRLANDFKFYLRANDCLIDPKHIDSALLEEYHGDVCYVPSGGMVIARSLEYFRIPRDILAICLGKSTYSRCGIAVNITPLEPEWEGHVTLTVCNFSPLPVQLYAGEGIAQVVFLRAASPCGVSYRDRKGKYQAQKGITLSKIEPSDGSHG